MQVIYETINHWNRENGINPWRYIGSDEHNKPTYLGSSKLLLEDIKILGNVFFEKKIILSFPNVKLTNRELRNIESDIQKTKMCAEDITYYNRTNSSHKGYIETDEEKMIRMKKCHNGYLKWLESLTPDDKKEFRKKQGCDERNMKMKGKTYEEIYGVEKTKKIKQTIKDKISGSKNPRSKYDIFPEEKRMEARNKFKSGNYTHEALSKIYFVSRRLIGTVCKGIKIKKYKKYILIYENDTLVEKIDR
jgi:hypothetical protein